jgi:hypothetical protein
MEVRKVSSEERLKLQLVDNLDEEIVSGKKHSLIVLNL